MRLPKFAWIIGFFVLLCSGCTGGYTFTGASIPPDAKTFSVETFPNNALLVQPQLSQVLTDAMRNRFRQQTPLSMVDYDGDLDFKGEIVEYSMAPIAIQANDQAAQNRLTIAIRVKFTNKKDPKANFDQRFSRYKDYDSQENLSSVEDRLMDEITKLLVDDVFNKAVVNW